MPMDQDTVAAIATSPGRGSIGVVRVSGAKALDVCYSLTHKKIAPNQAKFVVFKGKDNRAIDEGIVLYFKAPHSFTGEDVIECHTHGSDVVLGILLEEIFSLGVKPARPGEFTERAFINNKIDLVQVEAIADLIDSQSKKAARSAFQSLSGEFSRKIHNLSKCIIEAKALLEASLDFPEEENIEIDCTSVAHNIRQAIQSIKTLLEKAKEGKFFDKNLKVVIVGKPNVGKSSLLNYLSEQEVAIVSSTSGTTRDLVSNNILLNGIGMTLVDTAGIRKTSDGVEREGVSRSYKALKTADIVLYVVDADNEEFNLDAYVAEETKKIVVRNKIDLEGNKSFFPNKNRVFVSAKTGKGMKTLIEFLSETVKATDNNENIFFARQRHIEALKQSVYYLKKAMSLLEKNDSPEFVAELLRKALDSFDELTGKIINDDILGEIFSRFCIGK